MLLMDNRLLLISLAESSISPAQQGIHRQAYNMLQWQLDFEVEIHWEVFLLDIQKVNLLDNDISKWIEMSC